MYVYTIMIRYCIYPYNRYFLCADSELFRSPQTGNPRRISVHGAESNLIARNESQTWNKSSCPTVSSELSSCPPLQHQVGLCEQSKSELTQKWLKSEVTGLGLCCLVATRGFLPLRFSYARVFATEIFICIAPSDCRRSPGAIHSRQQSI